MTSRRDKRKKAYEFLYEKLQKLGRTASSRIDRNIDNVSPVSLAEIDDPKKGLADPSKEFISELKILLHHIASESEIEEYLIKPFLSRSKISEKTIINL